MYYVVYGFIWLLSLLPMRVLYFLSDAMYGLAFYILKYRRDVVMKNLLIAFPEKTEAERKKISKRFYHNLIDTFVEVIKLVTASQRFLEKRATCNWDSLNLSYPSGKSLQVHLGHNFNWEWANAVIAKHTPYKVLAVYMPASSKTFDRLFMNIRSKANVVMLPATKMKESFLPYAQQQYMLGLVADQNPGHPDNAWWVNFFGRPTPFVKGPAKAAVQNKTAVAFAFIHKKKRGYYEGVVSPLNIDIETITEQELTVKFVEYLEDVIRKYPEMWLWSHRRWKWEWKPEHGPVIGGRPLVRVDTNQGNSVDTNQGNSVDTNK